MDPNDSSGNILFGRWRKISKTVPFLILAMFLDSSRAWLSIWAQKLIGMCFIDFTIIYFIGQ
jgi:hypothetical protein